MRLGRLLIILVGLVAAASAWFAVRAVEHRRYENELDQARRDFAARRFATARARLVRLARSRPGQGEVEYLLGNCEKIRGHAEAALDAWGRVPAGAPQAPVATLSRARLALDLGRYRLGETCLDGLKDAGGDIGEEAWRLLGWIYWMTGRWDEHRKVLHREIERAADPSSLLHALWSADYDHYPLESISQELAKAHQCGTRRRSRLAGAGRPGDVQGAAGRGRRLAVALRTGPAR